MSKANPPRPTMSELEDILAQYFTWKGEAIHEINQTQNYKRLKQALSAYTDRAVTKELADIADGFEAGIKTAPISEEDKKAFTYIMQPMVNAIRNRIKALTISVRDGGETSSQRGKT